MASLILLGRIKVDRIGVLHDRPYTSALSLSRSVEHSYVSLSTRDETTCSTPLSCQVIC